MSKTRHKAVVYLKQTVTCPNGSVGTPALYTQSSPDRDDVWNFVKALYEQGIIIAYRMLISPGGEEDSYCMTEGVVFLEDGHGPVVSVIGGHAAVTV